MNSVNQNLRLKCLATKKKRRNGCSHSEVELFFLRDFDSALFTFSFNIFKSKSTCFKCVRKDKQANRSVNFPSNKVEDMKILPSPTTSSSNFLLKTFASPFFGIHR